MARSPEEWLELAETGELNPAEFHHRDHVALAWALLRRDPPLLAMATYIETLQRLTRSAGRPEAFHSTITWAFLLLIQERMSRQPEASWEDFERDHPELFAWRPSLLERYYRPETLSSELARQVFLMPDRLASVATT